MFPSALSKATSNIPALTFNALKREVELGPAGLCYKRQFAVFLKSPFGPGDNKVCMSSNNGLPRGASKTLVKLRISSHKLRIEAGRYDISKIQLGPIPMLRSDWLSYY